MTLHQKGQAYLGELSIYRDFRVARFQDTTGRLLVNHDQLILKGGKLMDKNERLPPRRRLCVGGCEWVRRVRGQLSKDLCRGARRRQKGRRTPGVDSWTPAISERRLRHRPDRYSSTDLKEPRGKFGRLRQPTPIPSSLLSLILNDQF